MRTLEAELDISDLFDPGAMAEAVSDELGRGRGSQGSLRSPHDCWVEPAPGPIRFITVVAADKSEMQPALRRIEKILRRDPRWKVLSIKDRAVSRFEAEVALDLVKVPKH